MVLSRSKLLFWLLTILAIGLACGYLFSSKFCSISIGKRVEKISTLNQKLRNLFALRTFYNFESAQSKELKIKNEESTRAHLLKINEEISNLVAAYYDKQSGQKIVQGLEQHISSEEFATVLAQLNSTWAFCVTDIKNNLVSSQDTLAQIQEALSNNNWERAFNLFEKNLALAMEFADELDKGINHQFPHKF